jgi:2-polyprenyl-3-methyl-5-hydroxy-6-metoxy-1,4-benzoquinol methylase
MIINNPQFGICSIADSQINELCTFLKLPLDECLYRLENYTLTTMAEDWNKANPQTPKEIRHFYENTENYIWELTLWHNSKLYKQYLDAVQKAIQLSISAGGNLALDYGSGIGTTAAMLASAGFQVEISDVPGRTFDFAQYHLSCQGVSFKAIPVLDVLANLEQGYDLIISIDVLEHIEQPDLVLNHLSKHLRTSGIAVITVAFEDNDKHPYHLATSHQKFTEGRWDLELSRSGLKTIDWFTYRKVSNKSLLLRQLRYWIWKKSGFYIQRIPRAN